MRKDYAKSNRSKINSKHSPRRHAKKASTEGRLWLIVCGLIALFALGLIYLKKESAKLPQAEEPKKITAVTPKKEVPSAPVQPRFDFYTMLPSDKNADSTGAEAPAQETKSASATPNTKSNTKSASKPSTVKQTAKATTDESSTRNEIASLEKQQLVAESTSGAHGQEAATVSPHYVLQFGIFKDFTAADEQKAQLVLQGVEAKIKTVKKNGNTLYQVWVGPYKTGAQAEKMQQKLKAEQIKTVMVKSA